VSSATEQSYRATEFGSLSGHDCGVPEPDEPYELRGGWENAGAVWRVGREVRRPGSASTVTVQALARHLRIRGLSEVAEPLGVDEQGRERWVYIEGYVPSGEFPGWVCSRSTLCRVAAVLRRFHDAGRDFPIRDGRWNREMASLHGGPVIGHNDVCPENVVFRNRVPVGLVDLDFAAPTDPHLDLAILARLWSPLEDGQFTGEYPLARVVAAVHAYGPDGIDPDAFHQALLHSHQLGVAFMTRRVTRGQEPFVTAWRVSGGQAERDRRLQWWSDHRAELIRALTRRIS
jgi:Phosphotransferase enzyme family